MTFQNTESWSTLLKRYRLRQGISRVDLAALLGVSQRTLSGWERDEAAPHPRIQRSLRDLTQSPTATLSWQTLASVMRCPLPRALCRTQALRLQVVSPAALAKRPSVADLIGTDLAPLAAGVLAEMLDDMPLQRSIARGEIACVLATTRSVLRTVEHEGVGTYQTTITYFIHDGTLYSDAMSVPAPAGTPLGYRVIAMDDCAYG